MNEEKLIKLGFKKTDDPVTPFQYEINLPIDAANEGKPVLALTRERNIWEFALFIEPIIIYTDIKDENDIIEFVKHISAIGSYY